MHRSTTGYPSASLTEASDPAESPSTSASPAPTLPSPGSAPAVPHARPRSPSMNSSSELSRDPPTSRPISSAGQPRGRDETVAPVPALPRRPAHEGWIGLRRPKPVTVRRATASTPPVAMGVSSLAYPMAHPMPPPAPASTQLLSPLAGVGLSRQTSLVNHSRVGMRAPSPTGYRLPLSPVSPAAAAEGLHGVTRRWASGAEAARRRVGALTAGTTGNQMGRNVDSHVYLQTHVMSGAQRLLLSPTQGVHHPSALAVSSPPMAGLVGVLSPGTSASAAGLVVPPVVATERASPLLGVLGTGSFNSSPASLTTASPGDMTSSSLLSGALLVTPARRGPTPVNTTTTTTTTAAAAAAAVAVEAAHARQNSFAQSRRAVPPCVRPTSPFSDDTSVRLGSPYEEAVPASRLPSTTLVSGNSSHGLSPPVSGDVVPTALRRGLPVLAPDSGFSTSSVVSLTGPALSGGAGAVAAPAAPTVSSGGGGGGGGGSPRRTRAEAVPAAPKHALSFFQPPAQNTLEDLKELLRANASVTGKPELASSAAMGASASSTPIPNDFIGDRTSERASRLASPTQEPLPSFSRSGCAGASMADVSTRRRGVFGLFGLLERNSRFEELYVLYASQPCLREFVAAVKAHVADISRQEKVSWMARSFHTIFFLLDNPTETQKIGLEYYRNPMIAWPLHVLYLVGCYRITAHQYGFPALHGAIIHSGGLLAMGKGLFAALAVAMSDSEESLAWQTARMMCAAFTMGVIMRRRLDAWEMHMSNSVSRSFSFLLVNLPTSTLRQLVDEVNECRGIDFAAARARAGHGKNADTGKDSYDRTGMGSAGTSFSTTASISRFGESSVNGAGVGLHMPPAPYGGSGLNTTHASARRAADVPSDVLPRTHLEVSRVISSRSAVVCGHPLDLDRLDIVLSRYANSTGVKIHKDFIPSCAPENSSYYNEDMVFELLACWQYSNTVFDPSDLHVPLFSPVDGERWNSQTLVTPDAFAKRVAEAVTYRNQDLTYSLQHIADGDCLLDFTTMPLTMGAVVEWTNKQFDIISVPVNRREHAMLPPPRRSQQPSGVRGTLIRLALVNLVLDELVSEGAITMPSAWRTDPIAENLGRRRTDPAKVARLACGVQLSTTFEELGLVLYVKNPNTYRALALAKARRERQDLAPAYTAPVAAAALSALPTQNTSILTNATNTHNMAHAMAPESVRPRRPSAVLVPLETYGLHDTSANDGPSTGLVRATDSESPLCVVSSHERERLMAAIKTPTPTTTSSGGGSTLVDMVGSSSRSGGGDTVVPALSLTSTADTSHGFRSLHDGNASASVPRLRDRLGSAGDLSTLSGEAEHAMPTILDADEVSNLTSPVRQQPRSRLRGAANALDSSEAQIFSTSIARRPDDCAIPAPRPSGEPRDKLYKSDFVVQQNAFLENVVNVYQVSPVVRYYEMQFGCVLCDGAIAFTERLKSKTGMSFPPYMLLMCTTVFELLELWDGYDFVNDCC